MIPRLFLPVFAFAIAAPATAGTPVEIRLAGQRVVNADTVRLADVAEIRATDPRLRDSLSGLHLDTAPAPGGSRRIDRRAIASRIHRAVAAAVELRWSGAEAVTVERQAARLDSAEVVRVAQDSLLKQLRASRPQLTRVHLEPRLSPTAWSLPAGKVQVQARPAPIGRLQARMCQWVDVRVDNRRVLTVPVWFAVQAFQKVYVTESTIQSRHAVDGSRLRIEERDIASIPGPALPAGGDPTGLRARRTLPAGAILRERDVEPRPPVARSQVIAVLVKGPGIQIETRGVAMNDARLGERVSVRNPDSGRQYVAHVIADGRAQVTGP